MLLVEGIGDMEVVGALLDAKQIAPGFAISVENGINNLKQRFIVSLKATNQLKKLWVIADADSNCNAKWQMLRDCMTRHSGYDVNPKTPLPSEGAVFTPTNKQGITVGIWIMPDNSNAGMLENFIDMLVKSDDTLIAEARSIVDTLDAQRDRHSGIFKPIHKPKATIHTWLAWQDVPGRSIGSAILRKRLETSKPLCESFMQWLMNLQPE